jgi:MoxR-like ATPase
MNTTGRIAPEQLEQAVKVVAAMRAQVARAMVGQAEVVEQTIAALLAGGHVLIEGVPGPRPSTGNSHAYSSRPT